MCEFESAILKKSFLAAVSLRAFNSDEKYLFQYVYCIQMYLETRKFMKKKNNEYSVYFYHSLLFYALNVE